MAEQTVSDLVKTSNSTNVDNDAFAKIFEADTTPIDIWELYEFHKNTLAAVNQSLAEKFLLQGQKLKKYINENIKIGGSIKFHGFTVKRGGNIGRNDLNLTRLTALIAIKAKVSKWSIETAMFQRLNAEMRVHLKDISSIMAPGLQFLYRAAIKSAEKDAIGDVLKFGENTKNFSAQIFVGAVVMDHMTCIFTKSKFYSYTVVPMRNFVNDELFEMRGVCSGILANIGGKEKNDLQQTAEGLQLIKRCLDSDHIPVQRGGVQGRVKAVIFEIMKS